MPTELVKRTKVFAAAHDTSISALVSELLEELVSEGSSYDELWEAEERVIAQRPLKVGVVSWSRDELHGR